MFFLHPRLHADTLPVAELALCSVLLMNDAAYPWLILVPRRPDVSEWHDLEAADRALLTEEIAHVSQRLKQAVGADKINVAALGNMVPQLHVHVIARFADDPCWPRPVWGQAAATPYSPGEAQLRLETLKAALEPEPPSC